MNKPEIICEIGLNHLGDPDYAKEYIDALLKTPPDGITLQLPGASYFQKESRVHLQIDESFYETAIRKVKESGVKFGMALGNPDKVDLFENLGIGFYKVLGKDIGDSLLMSKILKTGKKVYVSTGLSSIEEVGNFVRQVKGFEDQITLIHTQLSHKISEANLKAIKVMGQRFSLPVGFGSHSTNPNILYAVLGLEPACIFFYVRGNRNMRHPDEEHAVHLSEYPQVIKNLNELSLAFGEGEKIKIGNTIEGEDKP